MADEEAKARRKAARKRIAHLAAALGHRLGDDVGPDSAEREPEFAEGVELLVAEDMPVTTVVEIAAGDDVWAACMAHAALARRADTPEHVISRALRWLDGTGALERCFIFRLLAAHADRPLVTETLGHADPMWAQQPVLGEVVRFVAARMEAGEEIRGDDLARRLTIEIQEPIAAIADMLEDEVPAVRSGLVAWRRTQIDWPFLTAFAHRVEPPAGEARLDVGDRSAVVTAIVDSVRQRRSVVLVGEQGVGKSTLAREALRSLQELGWQAFEASASAVHAGQMYLGMLEGRVQEIARRMDQRELVWLLPELSEAFWAGQHDHGPHGLLDALFPYVESRQVVVLAEIEPSAYELVRRHRPKLPVLFESVRVVALEEREALQVARSWAEEQRLDVTDETLVDAYELAEHYIPGLAAPQNVLRLLRATEARTSRGGSSDVRSAEVLETLSETSGLPLHVLDPSARLHLERVRRFFAERILGQPEAVDCLVERIALIKARLTDPTRPLGVFLFVGPTGTGKTEIAKTLAEFLFGSADRMIRLDMSEFQTPDSLERLLSDSIVSGHGATLISSVRKEPFSVVLLDEFEKAHVNVWDVFLQLFDDGRLTDQAGRTADFRHCVVILTSNIGSAIASGAPLGFSGDRVPFDPQVIERAVERSFRPELLNRLDRVVVFRPLTRDHMRELVHLELRRALARRGFRTRPWAIEWDDAAIDFLLDKGFSSELGARPLKRAIERELLTQLAITIVERDFPEGDQFLLVSARSGRIVVTFVDPDEPESRDADNGEPAAREPRTPGRLALDAHGEPTEVSFLAEGLGEIVHELDGEAWRGEKERLLEATHAPWFWDRDDRFAVLGRLEYVDRIEAATRTARSLLERLESRRTGGRPARRLVRMLAERVHLLDHAVAGLRRGECADALISIHASASSQAEREAQAFVSELESMYSGWAASRGMTLTRDDAPDGVTLAVSGIAAYWILSPESGLHILEVPENGRSFERVAAVVDVRPIGFGALETPPEPGDTSPKRIVRRYRREPSPLVRDSVRGWRTGRLDRVLAGDFDLLG